MNLKCPSCIDAKIGHSFSSCLASWCRCNCVDQIYALKNNNLEEAAIEHPHYLEIDDQDIKRLPDAGHSVRNFSRVKKLEWTTTKVDKRRKKPLFEY